MRYEFECSECGVIVEVDRKIAERTRPPTVGEHACREEGAPAVRVFHRVLSAPQGRFPGADDWRRR